jgi:nicotinate phosphoribosyltransferase
MTETNRWTQKRNLTMLTDFYELTMANGYLKHGMQDKIAYFDMFFRKIPDDGGYAIMAGLEQMIEYLNDLVFTERDIAYLKSKKIFSDEFLDYLKNFKFSFTYLPKTQVKTKMILTTGSIKRIGIKK